MNHAEAQECFEAIDSALHKAGVRTDKARLRIARSEHEEGYQWQGKGFTKREDTCRLRWGIESGRVDGETIFGVSLDFEQWGCEGWEDTNLSAISVNEERTGDGWNLNVDTTNPKKFRTKRENETEQEYFEELILGEFVPYVARMYLRKKEEEEGEDAAKEFIAVLKEIASLPMAGTPVLRRRQPRRLS